MHINSSALLASLFVKCLTILSRDRNKKNKVSCIWGSNFPYTAGYKLLVLQNNGFQKDMKEIVESLISATHLSCAFYSRYTIRSRISFLPNIYISFSQGLGDTREKL